MAASSLLLAGAIALLDGCAPTYTPADVPYFGRGAPPGARSAPTDPEVESPTAPASPRAEAATPTVLELPDVIRACVLSDPRIRASLEDVRAAQADYTGAGSLPNPALHVGHAGVPFPGNSFTSSSPGGPTQLSVDVSYALDGILFGKRSAGMETAKLAVDVAAAERADVVRVRVLEAINLYYDALQAKALLELAKEAYTQVKTLEAITSQRVTLGSVPSIELDRVRLAALASHRDLLRAEAEVDKSFMRLRARLGSAFTKATIDVAGSLQLASAPEAPTLADALATAEASRPDVIAAKRAVDRNAAEVRAQRRNGYPDLSVSLGYAHQFQTSLGSPDADSWGVGLGTSLPIFNRNQGAVLRAEATYRQSVTVLDAVLLELRADVEQALREYAVARAIVTQDVLGTLAAAGAAREKILESYRLGGKALIEVLDAQNAYREAVRLTIEARANFWKAKHSLNAALGKEVLP
jgi:cobalt-zinc-cadmium efflux system outer membrane protein